MQTSPALGMFLIGSIGIPEVLFIIGIAVLLFGGKRLGDIGRGLGEGIRNFRVAVKEDEKDKKSVEGEKTTKPSG